MAGGERSTGGAGCSEKDVLQGKHDVDPHEDSWRMCARARLFVAVCVFFPPGKGIFCRKGLWKSR